MRLLANLSLFQLDQTLQRLMPDTSCTSRPVNDPARGCKSKHDEEHADANASKESPIFEGWDW